MSVYDLSNKVQLNVGFYDPFSIFQGGFRSDFEKHVSFPSFYWKNDHENLKVLKNLKLNFIEEIPHSKNDANELVYLKFMFISCQTIEDYRAKIRPLVLQWLNSMKNDQPKTPYIIFFFENTELRTAADKYLKTNLFNKLKLDFDNKEFIVENLFKIKSIYPTNEDKLEAWKIATSSLKSLLNESINKNILCSKEDYVTLAGIYESLGQVQDALNCYSKLSSKYQFVEKKDFEQIGLSEITKLLNSESTLNFSNKNSKFLQKAWFYKQQETILLKHEITDLLYLKNVNRLAQILLSFLNSLEMCYKRNEIVYLFVKSFMDNDHMWKLLDLHKDSSNELIDCIADLKLLQRNELIALGVTKNYKVKGSMAIIDTQFENQKYKIICSEIEKILSDERAFIDVIIELTRDLIKYYTLSSVKMSTIATLSTELALILYYSTDDYETACEQLVKSYDFFFANGWKYIGITLLEVYIQNTDKLIKSHGENIVSQLLSCYISLAVNKSGKFNEDEFKNLSVKLKNKEIFKTTSLLKLNNVSSVYTNTSDTYKIDLSFTSDILCKVDKIELFLRNKKNEIISFKISDTNVDHDNLITLSCSKIAFDDFKANNIVVTIGKFEIIQPLKFSIHITEISTFVNNGAETFLHNTRTSIKIPDVRFLHSDQLLYEVKIGSNDIKNIEFVFMKTDTDKLLKDSVYTMNIKDSKSTREIKNVVSETEKKLTFKPEEDQIYEKDSLLQLQIPYFFPPDVTNTILDVYYIFNFELLQNDGEVITCSQKKWSQIESLLPIAVSVDEILRSSYIENSEDPKSELQFSLFSHFNINSVSLQNPIRIQKVELVSKRSIIETCNSPKNVIAFMEQGATYFYKIRNFYEEDVLLKIEYNNIYDEIIEFLNLTFLEFLADEKKSINLNDRFIFSSVADKLWRNMTYKLNYFALTNKIVPMDFQKATLFQLSKYIHKNNRIMFEDLIQNFLNYLKNIEVDTIFKTKVIKNVKQELRIDVNLPQVDIVNIIEYKYDKELQYLVCEPIKAKVTLDIHILQHKTKNKQLNKKQVRFSSEKREIDEFVNIELGFTDQDQRWIISGMKDLQLDINIDEAIKSNGSHYDYEITFIPLKPGKLQLPGIELLSQSDKDLIIELDHKNTAESVMVVSELNKIIHSF